MMIKENVKTSIMPMSGEMVEVNMARLHRRQICIAVYRYREEAY